MMKAKCCILALALILCLLPVAVHAEARRPMYAVPGDNGLYGYIDSLGQWVIDPQFDWADDFRGDYACASAYPEDAEDEEADMLDGIIDVTGAWVLEPKYDVLYLDEGGRAAGGWDAGYFHVSMWSDSNKLCGWFNVPNGYFSGFRYERVYIGWGESEACTGPALEVTEEGGAWAFVDRHTGAYLIPPQEDWSQAGEYAEGFVPVKNGDEYALLSGDGAVILLPDGYRFSAWNVDQVSQGMIPVENVETGLIGFMDTMGRIVIEAAFTDAWSFRDGVACVQFPEGDFGHIDAHGKTLYRGAPYAYSFSHGMAAVADGSVEDTLIVIRLSGEEAFRVTLEALYTLRFFDDSGVGVYEVMKATQHYMAAWDWTYSTLFAYGLISNRGEILTEPVFYLTEDDWDEALFSEGLAAMCDLETLLMGYVDETGQWVIPPQYDAAGEFREGCAWVRLDGQRLYIDREGNVLFSYTW